MYSITQRLNAVSALATSVVVCLLLAIAATSFIIPTPFDPAHIEVPKVQVIYGRDARSLYDSTSREYAHLRFNLRADLSPLFHWNTKQLYVSLAAKYGTEGYGDNEVVVWDRIVRRKKDARVNVEGARNKYAFKEVGGASRT